MSLEAIHIMLVSGGSFAECRERVIHFFEKNFLVRYDQVNIVEERSCSASSGDFWLRLEDAIDQNRSTVADLVKELQENGFREIADLNNMEQGYESKVLHVITHMLDGFFGADTVFYNLEEDSHGLSGSLEKQIHELPKKFWLIEVACSSSTGSDQLDKIRSFEGKPDK